MGWVKRTQSLTGPFIVYVKKVKKEGSVYYTITSRRDLLAEEVPGLVGELAKEELNLLAKLIGTESNVKKDIFRSAVHQFILAKKSLIDLHKLTKLGKSYSKVFLYNRKDSL